MTREELNVLVTEWWTGLDAEGNPGRHSEWPYRAQGTEPTIEQLAATLSTGLSGDDFVRVSLARGADGETDVRIEIESAGVVEVTRWRPVEGNLDTGALWGGRTLAKERSPEASASREQQFTDAIRAPSTITLDDVQACTHALKTRRKELRERVEAGAPLATELADVESKIAALAVRNVELNEERRDALTGGGRG